MSDKVDETLRQMAKFADDVRAEITKINNRIDTEFVTINSRLQDIQTELKSLQHLSRTLRGITELLIENNDTLGINAHLKSE